MSLDRNLNDVTSQDIATTAESHAVVAGGTDAGGLVRQLLTDSNGKVEITGGAANLPVTDASTGATNATAPLFATEIGAVDSGGKLQALNIDSSGNLKVVNTGGGSNAAAGSTGSAVPASADYTGLNIAGNLVGQTGHSLTNAKAADVAIVDGSGNQITSFGGGTQYSDGTTQATPTGTIALGKNSSNVLHSLSLDGSGNLNVNLAAGTISGGNAAASATAAAVPADADYLGAKDGSGNLQGLLVESSSSPNLRVSVFNGTSEMPAGDSSSHSIHTTVDNASLAVTGTFWQTTQPVSGTVTANAGSGTFNTSDANAISQGSTTSGEKGFLELGAVTTNAPTYTTAQSSPLSLDTSGLLRVSVKDTPANTTAFKVDGSAVTQPVSGTVTVGNSTLAVTESGTWNVGLNSGTNLIGISSSPNETSTVYNGTTALTPTFSTVVASASGATTIVALVASKRIRVLALQLTANAAVNVKWQSHTTPTDLTGLAYLAANGGYVLPFNPVGWFQTNSGEALDVNLSAAVAIGGSITYIAV